MSYIYDILLNFHEEPYDFYEWNKNDNIINIKKIPLFKISHQKFIDVINNNVLFHLDLLEKIKNKTEEYTNRRTRTIMYAFLLTDGISVLAININNKTLYSKLLLDEESEVVNASKRLKESCIKYEIISPKNSIINKTRSENELESKIIDELKSMIRKNNVDELKYIYYDFFNIKTDDIDKIKEELYEKILNGDIINQFADFLKLKKCIKY